MIQPTGETVAIQAEIVPTPKLPAPPKQLEGESDAMYERFVHYCNAPARDERRSWTATGRRFGVDHKTIMDCARRYDWIARTVEWDRTRVLNAAQKAGELQATTAVSHVSLAQDLVDQAAVVMRKCDEMLAAEMDLEVLQMWQQLASGVSKILEKSQKAARLALGQSDSNVSIKQEVTVKHREIDYARASADERAILRAAEMITMRLTAEGAVPVSVQERAAVGEAVRLLGPGAAA